LLGMSFDFLFPIGVFKLFQMMKNEKK
jgi:hypothetical protein